MAPCGEQSQLFRLPPQDKRDNYLKNLPKARERSLGNINGIKAYEIDIHYTIPELAYLTHNFYRYYGKFPSVLGGFLIEKYASDEAVVFDNYVGCGTALVEAKLRGFHSSGIDVNPIAVLASKVKTRVYPDVKKLERYLRDILDKACGMSDSSVASLPSSEFLEKWFDPGNTLRLAKLKQAIVEQPSDCLREFATICFLAIIRRCSKAYDGEVRPHINPKKKLRDPFDAFEDKMMDMVDRERDFAEIAAQDVEARAFCASNTEPDLKGYMPFGSPDLVISHPPYLNCFNYYAVFNLENVWSEGISEAEQDVDKAWVRKNEHICWPATNSRIVDSYYANLNQAYSNLRKNVGRYVILCIVIGDATVRKRLLPVHKDILEFLPSCGFKPMEIVYRTTHYGIGKYAYRHRADYHGKSQKKDAVLISVSE